MSESDAAKPRTAQMHPRRLYVFMPTDDQMFCCGCVPDYKQEGPEDLFVFSGSAENQGQLTGVSTDSGLITVCLKGNG